MDRVLYDSMDTDVDSVLWSIKMFHAVPTQKCEWLRQSIWTKHSRVVLTYLPVCFSNAMLLSSLLSYKKSSADSMHQHAAMQQLSAKVFRFSFKYLHIYSHKNGNSCRRKVAKLHHYVLSKVRFMENIAMQPQLRFRAGVHNLFEG